jgi:hypothetical protein
MGKCASMKPTRTTQDLDSLLGRGSIGAARRDAILQTVLARVKAETPARARGRWSFAGLGIVAATTAVLIFLGPRFSSSDLSPFRAKGTALTMPSVHIECLGATLGACPSGSLLVVRVAGVRGFVSAWAEPVSGGERIWYFSAETLSPLVDAVSAIPPATTRAVKLGHEHAVGTYVVDIRVTDRPIGRDSLLHLPASAVLAKGQASLTVTSP